VFGNPDERWEGKTTDTKVSWCRGNHYRADGSLIRKGEGARWDVGLGRGRKAQDPVLHEKYGSIGASGAEAVRREVRSSGRVPLSTTLEVRGLIIRPPPGKKEVGGQNRKGREL